MIMSDDGKPDILIRSLDMALAIQDEITIVYFIRELRKIHIDIRDSESGKINLQEFTAKAFEHCGENWEDSWGHQLAPALYMLHVRQTHGNFPSGDGVTMAWEQAMAFGILVERLRKKYNLTFDISETALTPEQMANELGEDSE